MKTNWLLWLHELGGLFAVVAMIAAGITIGIKIGGWVWTLCASRPAITLIVGGGLLSTALVAVAMGTTFKWLERRGK